MEGGNRGGEGAGGGEREKAIVFIPNHQNTFTGE
jgi:hypothetical protein